VTRPPLPRGAIFFFSPAPPAPPPEPTGGSGALSPPFPCFCPVLRPERARARRPPRPPPGSPARPPAAPPPGADAPPPPPAPSPERPGFERKLTQPSLRLVTLGGMSLLFDDENNEINLWDFAGSSLGLIDDRDSTSLDVFLDSGKSSDQHKVNGGNTDLSRD